MVRGLLFSHGCCFFFFKQKTAYEMRISDWSSDVCSSDLQGRSLHLQRLGDGDIPTLGMGMMLGPAPALGLQPPVELGQAGEPESRLEEAAPDRKSVV